MRDDRVQIIGHPAVVKTQQPVGLPGTPSEIQTYGIVPDTVHLPCHAQGIFFSSVPLETMADDNHGVGIVSRSAMSIDVDKITIRGVDALTKGSVYRRGSEQCGEYGVHMAVGQRPDRSVIRDG
jgi:hypothetical protein